MTHFHDADIKKALLEVAPKEKTLIDSTKFGEIAKPSVSTNPYV
jgi:carbonic anhydrase